MRWALLLKELIFEPPLVKDIAFSGLDDEQDLCTRRDFRWGSARLTRKPTQERRKLCEPLPGLRRAWQWCRWWENYLLLYGETS